MIITSETLLGETVYGTASGNYDGSSQLFYGDPVIAANYYGGLGNDYEVNVKAELEIELLHQKIDLMREQEIKTLTVLVSNLTRQIQQLQPR